MMLDNGAGTCSHTGEGQREYDSYGYEKDSDILAGCVEAIEEDKLEHDGDDGFEAADDGGQAAVHLFGPTIEQYQRSNRGYQHQACDPPPAEGFEHQYTITGEGEDHRHDDGASGHHIGGDHGAWNRHDATMLYTEDIPGIRYGRHGGKDDTKGGDAGIGKVQGENDAAEDDEVAYEI